MANILIAASAKPREILREILAGHELTFADSIPQAERFLCKMNFDLIVCTIVFDDSRMFDFLRLVKARAEWREIPFVCARARANVMRFPIALEAVAFTCRTLGATAFLDIEKYRKDPAGEMRADIERCLKKPARTSRGNVHA